MALLALTGCSTTTGDDSETAGRVNAAAEDDALRRCINGQLGFSADSKVSVEVAQSLHHLDCIDEGVKSLAGIEYYTELETISLWENDIQSLNGLEDLTKLRWLEIGNNEILDLEPISELTGLTRLGVSSNEISDLSPLSELINLQWLNLDDNEISDATALESLDQLTWLTIEHNRIESASALSGIGSNDIDVYHQHQADGPSGPPAPTAVGTLDPKTGTLLPTPGQNGTLLLDLAVARSIYPVQLELPGDLRDDNGRIVLEKNGELIPIGKTDGATAELCENGERCSVIIGLKVAPPEAYAGLRPAPVVSMTIGLHGPPAGEDSNEDDYGARDEGLIDYVFASPNQFDAGSCLFMTTTGAMELLIHQHTDLDTIEYNGDTDLSERFLMAAYQDVPSSTLSYWLTDTVYTYNYIGGSLLNRDYPFTAGYVRETSGGSLVPCDAGDDGAYYSCSYNWFDERPGNWESLLVDTPAVERTVAFIDPAQNASSQWNVGLMDDEDVEKIKYMLRTRRAPVVVIYNHYLYWHADIIVGYDDTVETNGCPMVDSSMDYFDEQGSGAYTRRIENHMDDIGDCTSRGIFYVRDSIYEGTSDEPDYQYSAGFTEKYSERIVERTYNWVKYLGNHAYAIHRK
jgi:hypothetical protein